MKPAPLVLVVSTIVALGCPGLTAAETVRLRHLASAYADDQSAGFRVPEGVACGDQGRVVIADTGNDRLVLFAFLDKKFSPGREIKIPELSAPARVRLSPKGEIYVLDGRRHRVVRLSSEGSFIGALSPEGIPPPASIVAKGFALDAEGKVHVLDVFGDRVLVLDEQGKFQRALPLPADSGFVSDIAVDSEGRILLLDSLNRRVYLAARDAAAFTSQGRDLTDVVSTLPTAVTTSRGTILIAGGSESSIVTLGQDGAFLAKALTMGWNEGALNHPSQICVNDNDEVFIADTGNSRVQVFALTR